MKIIRSMMILEVEGVMIWSAGKFIRQIQIIFIISLFKVAAHPLNPDDREQDRYELQGQLPEPR